MTVASTGEAEATSTARPEIRTTRIPPLVLLAATLALLLVGAAAGMLITLLGVDQNAPPGDGSVDVGFAQDMSVHHAQAVTLAGWARHHSTDPAIRTLAFDIESTQLGQVGTIHGWLDLWNRPISSSGGFMAWMTGPTHGHSSTTGSVPDGGLRVMPGMATQQEIARLRSLTGRKLDVYFLQLMLRHHAGGAPMAQYAAERAGTGQVRALARSILASQTAEMNTVKGMLAERGARPLP